MICPFFSLYTLCDLCWHVSQGINKLVYSERFPAKTENKHRRKYKHQWMSPRGLFSQNLNKCGIRHLLLLYIFLLYIRVILKWWMNQNAIAHFHLKNIVRVHCPCTLLLSADTTVSSDFLQVYYKNLKPPSTAAAEWTLLPLRWRPLRASTVGCVCLLVVHWWGLVKLGSQVRGQPWPWCRIGDLESTP